MKKERIIAAVLAVVMAVSVFAGCAKKTPWQDEARTLVAEKMDDSNVGKFVIDGYKFDFPMTVKDLTDNGWKFESESVGSERVGSYCWYTKYINLKSANNKSIEIAVYNNTDADSTIAESSVGEVRISNLRGNAMISGGIDFYGTTFEANGKLGDHAADGFELDVDTEAHRDNVFTKQFVGSNGKNCTATFIFSEFNGNIVLSEVKYECSFEISYVDATQAVILAVINNDPTPIDDLDRELGGQELVDNMRSYIAEDFVYIAGFDIETLTDEQYQKLYKIIDTIYGQTQFTVEDKGFNTLVVFNAPKNLVEVAKAAFEAADEAYEGDLDSCMTDPEYLDLFLDAFDASALEFMPGSSYLITNGNFVDGVYEVMIYMLGFEQE